MNREIERKREVRFARFTRFDENTLHLLFSYTLYNSADNLSLSVDKQRLNNNAQYQRV